MRTNNSIPINLRIIVEEEAPHWTNHLPHPFVTSCLWTVALSYGLHKLHEAEGCPLGPGKDEK